MPNKDVHIIDGSHWRWPTPLTLLEQNGEQGFITKATEGLTWVDDYYDDWEKQAEAIDMPFGSFHYWRASQDPLIQAKHYFDIATARKRPLFPPIIDVEKTNNYGVLPLSSASAHLEIVALETYRLWGEKPWIYTSYYSVKDMLGNPNWMGNYFLWCASHREDRPSIPVPWQNRPDPKYILWQHTKRWPIPGAAFAGYDGNWWWGDQASYDTYIANRPPPSSSPSLPFPFMGKVSLPSNLNIFDVPQGHRVGLLPHETGVSVLSEVKDTEQIKWYKLGDGSFVKAKYIIPME